MIVAEHLRLPGIAHGFFTRQGGHSDGIFASLNCGLGSGDDRDCVLRNRAAVASSLGVAAEGLITAHQVHSAEAVTVEEPWPHEGRPRADAMATRKPGIALAVLTADCGPVLFADGEAGVIGAAHAGWKGALAGVTESTLLAMERLGARRQRITAVIGPSISRLAYEVGPEFPAPFLEEDKSNRDFFRPSGRAGHTLFDLPGYLARRLAREGVGQIADLGLCTFGDEDRFYSYRRATHRSEKDYGRQISAIALMS